MLLSMAMPAGVEYIDKGYDVPRLNEYLDFVNLLSYDYHSAYEPAVNHHSPLYPLEEDNEYNYDAELTIVRVCSSRSYNYRLNRSISNAPPFLSNRIIRSPIFWKKVRPRIRSFLEYQRTVGRTRCSIKMLPNSDHPRMVQVLRERPLERKAILPITR